MIVLVLFKFYMFELAFNEKTPGPTDYYPELAKDSIKKASPSARMPTARRFSNNFF